jgi:hypothetical protein
LAEVKHKIRVFSQESKHFQNKIHEHLTILDESVSFVGLDFENQGDVQFHEMNRQIRQYLQKVLLHLSEAENLSKKIGDQEQEATKK